MRKKHKKLCMVLHCIEHLLILASAVTGYVYIFAFVSLVDSTLRMRWSLVGLKIFAVTAGTKTYKSIIKKKKKKHDKGFNSLIY